MPSAADMTVSPTGAEAMPLIVRTAAPGDAERLAALVYASGPAAFDYVFAHGGRSARAFLAFALADGRGLFGWPRHRIASIDGETVACLALFSGTELRQLSMATLRQYFRFYPPPSALRVLRRALRLGAMQPPPADHDLYIAHLSVAGPWQRRGIARALLDHAARCAAARGLRQCALDVAADNAAAQALYAAAGYRLVAERALPRGDSRVPPSRRYLKPLAQG